MVRSRTWTIEIRISEHDEEQDAVPATDRVRGHDPELAVVLALADLAGKLRDLTRDDTEAFVHGPGRLLA